MGCCTYHGAGTVTYELNLYDFSDARNPRSLQKLNCTFDRNVCVDGIVQLKFDKGIQVKPNVKYALTCYNSVNLTAYGQNGRHTILGPDGTKFQFSDHPTHSSGRTSIEMGQIPQILYGTETSERHVSFFFYNVFLL